MDQKNWYTLSQPDETDSPALLVYPQRIQKNIELMLAMTGNAQRLVPHVKTTKMPEVVRMQMDAGIQRFKCATIAEAEMLAASGVANILLAYQLNKSKALRFLRLVTQYPAARFASLVDNTESAQMLNKLFAEKSLVANVYIDIDDGMHRTGFTTSGDIAGLYQTVNAMPNIQCWGLHVYDGHFHDKAFPERKALAEAAMQPVMQAAKEIEATQNLSPEIIAGGTPTFSVHAPNECLLCSPGTCLLWDWGYSQKLKEQSFLHAAILLSRIISKPVKGRITTDLGHKSVAAENSVDKRVLFLNLGNYQVISQSEEHLVAEVSEEDWQRLKIGDVLYGIPYHICPTVALYDEVQVVEDNAVTRQWEVVARKKKITW